ncbi:ABC transporter substrate-binding protein, partial [Leucobacter sp. M11]|uniref:ABC transporter substrate-binding protein n=1 Tax=Leucobacter sp. M11 TaxID=2993565 RepID=UPI002D806EF5
TGSRLGKDGAPITLQLMYDASSTQNSSSAQFMQSWLKDLGIGLELKGTNWGEMLDLVPQGKYDMYISGWSVSGDPDYMLSINTCGTLPDSPGASSPSQDYMCDPEFDALYQAQHVETDPEQRIELVHQAMARHYDFASNLNLYYDDALEAYRSDRLTNLVEMNGSELNYWSIAQVELQDGAGSGGVPGWVWGVGGGVLVLAIAGIATASVRRKNTAADRQ